MPGKITAKQQQILDYIKEEILRKGYPPTVREICEKVGLRSTSSVHSHLATLEENGYIRRDPTKPRAIEIIDDEFGLARREMSNIPVVGRVAAGEPLLAVENIEDYFALPTEFLPNNETFILKIHGESMINVGFYENDYIIVERTSAVSNGDIVVALESSGIHTNGYTLVRKIMEDNPEIMNECLGEKTFIDAILEPHRCYYKALKDLFGKPHCIHGLAHITGGGICENLNRILPSGLDAKIDLECYNVLPIFKLLRKYGNISDTEMLRTFNLGVGMTLVTSKEYLDDVMQHLQNHGINCNVIGEIVKGNQKVICENNLVW